MSEKTIYLEAICHNNQLRIGIYESDDVIWMYQKKQIEISDISNRCQTMIDYINATRETPDDSDQTLSRLKGLGRGLCNDILPHRIKERLKQTDAQYLILIIDNQLAHIMWELICIDNSFLCERFAIGRKIKTTQDIPLTNKRQLSDTMKVLIIADPKGDLSVASEEGIDICRHMDDMSNENMLGNKHIETNIDCNFTSQELKEQIQDYDMVHFSGHGLFDPKFPGNSGWNLAYDHLTATDIHDMAGSADMPAFVFSNACQSANNKNTSQETDSTTGLSNAFILSGAFHYLGTLWDITDKHSCKFAKEFYMNLLSSCSIGEAVRRSRIKVMPNIDWAGYVLIGDPRFIYFNHSHKNDHVENSEYTRPFVQESITRGSNKFIGWDVSKVKEIRKWTILLIIILTLLYGIFFLNSMLNIFKSKHEQQIKNMLIELTQQKQREIDTLYQKLASIEGCSFITSSEIINIEFVFNDKNKEELAIIGRISNKLFTTQKYNILESSSQSLDNVLRNLINTLLLTPVDRRGNTPFQMPDIIIYARLYHDIDSTILFLRPIHAKKRTMICDHMFIPFDPDKSIREQENNLSDKLLFNLSKINKSEFNKEIK
ncbi:CHAT domain protein [Candidatus Magnetomorum sp. HK-1]|nr:CHAT domain protein [Candidatus Magnetomorum sp. HK-1]